MLEGLFERRGFLFAYSNLSLRKGILIFMVFIQTEELIKEVTSWQALDREDV
jgi:hypothetical protein